MKRLFRRPWESLKTGWYIWLFPIFAFAITGWLLYDYYSQRGPRIYLHLDDAASVQAEKTVVRYRGVQIGTVMDVFISENQSDAVAEILLRKDAGRFAVEGSKFSLVKASMNLQGISGLETIFEGSYFTVVPGPPGSHRKKVFNVEPMIPNPMDDVSVFLIEAPDVESITVGNAVTYRGMKVGTVGKLSLVKGGSRVNMQINIDNKYAFLVRTNSIFWRKIGVQAKFGLFGSEIKLNSMDSIINGGVQFANPPDAGPRAKAFQRFVLAPEAPKDLSKWIKADLKGLQEKKPEGDNLRL